MATKSSKRDVAGGIDRLADVLLRVRVVSRAESARVWAVKLYDEGVRVVEAERAPPPAPPEEELEV